MSAHETAAPVDTPFFTRGVLLSLLALQLFSKDVGAILSSPYSGLFDLFILLLLFIATLKR